VGQQPEKAATDEVLAEEDDDGGILFPGFASRRCRQVLGAGGCGDGLLLLVRLDNSKMVRWRLAMAGEAVAGAEQSNEECGQTVEGGSGVGGGFLGDVWSRDKGGAIHVGRRRPAATGAEPHSTW
jgi:hypothetical protein